MLYDQLELLVKMYKSRGTRHKRDSREARLEAVENEARIPHKIYIIRHMLIVGLAFSEDAKCQRAAVLNEASRPRIWCQQDERNVRNAATHGGNIIVDVHVIQNMEKDDPATADRWKTAFFRMYQLEFRDFNLPLLSAPTEDIWSGALKRVSDFSSP